MRRVLTPDNVPIVTGEAVLVATGRTPVTEHLGLDCVGAQIGKQGIQIDNQCRAAEGVWAVGDVVGAGFTHVADYQAQSGAYDIMGHSRLADYRAIPRIAYTDPEIAAVGITESSKAPEGMAIITAGTDLAYGHLRSGLHRAVMRFRRSEGAGAGRSVGGWSVGE